MADMPKIDGKYVADMPEFKEYLKRVYPKGITYWPRPGGAEDHITYKWHGYDTDLKNWNGKQYGLVKLALLRSGAVEGFMKEEAEKRAKAEAAAKEEAAKKELQRMADEEDAYFEQELKKKLILV